ncbi:MAG: SagB/ThcOx family dehydrogenase [Actinomycetota bacterium]|nr:SagB/ThcOx family dehydrogenase [Actinomycetota bacterium]
MYKKPCKHLSFTLLIVPVLILTFFPLNGCGKINIKDMLVKIQDQSANTSGKKDNKQTPKNFKNDEMLNNSYKDTKSEEIMLPDPKLKGIISLEEALKNRRSVREFSGKDLGLDDISQILWAAQGITESKLGFRTAPSAGALYPIEVFVVKSDGFFHYTPNGHKLEKFGSENLKQKLMEASLFQESISTASIVIIVTAIYERTTVKYGERGIRYVHLEAGHVCQNILLQAAALQLGAVPIGAFSDDEVRKALNLPTDHKPLYIIPVGYSK